MERACAVATSNRSRSGVRVFPARALTLLEHNLVAVVGWADLDVARFQADIVIDPSRDDRAFEDKLLEPPFLAALAHLHDDPAGAAPHAFPSRPEAPGDELPQAVGNHLGRRLCRWPHDGPLGRSGPRRRIAPCRFPELRLL